MAGCKRCALKGGKGKGKKKRKEKEKKRKKWGSKSFFSRSYPLLLAIKILMVSQFGDL